MFLSEKLNSYLNTKNVTLNSNYLDEKKIISSFDLTAPNYLKSFTIDFPKEIICQQKKLSFFLSFFFFYSVGMALHPLFLNIWDNVENSEIGDMPFYIQMSPALLNELLENYSPFKEFKKSNFDMTKKLFDDMDADEFNFFLSKTPFKFFEQNNGVFNVEVSLRFYVNSNKTFVYLTEKVEKFIFFLYLFFLQTMFYGFSRESSYVATEKKKSKSFILALENIRRYYSAFANNVNPRSNLLFSQEEVDKVLNLMLDSILKKDPLKDSFFNLFGGFIQIEEIFFLMLFNYWLKFFNSLSFGKPNQLILLEKLDFQTKYAPFLWNFDLSELIIDKENFKDSSNFLFDEFQDQLNYLKIPLVCNSLANSSINSDIFYAIRDPSIEKMFGIVSPYRMWHDSVIKF